jgi:hypothetical protein
MDNLQMYYNREMIARQPQGKYYWEWLESSPPESNQRIYAAPSSSNEASPGMVTRLRLRDSTVTACLFLPPLGRKRICSAISSKSPCVRLQSQFTWSHSHDLGSESRCHRQLCFKHWGTEDMYNFWTMQIRWKRLTSKYAWTLDFSWLSLTCL